MRIGKAAAAKPTGVYTAYGETRHAILINFNLWRASWEMGKDSATLDGALIWGFIPLRIHPGDFSERG